MVKNHLTRLAAPKTWPIKRKGIKFITRPNPGAYTLREGISLNLVMERLLKYAKTSRESKKILNSGKIFINGKIVKNHRYSLGVMDVLSIPELKEYYLLIKNTKNKFKLMKLNEKDARGRTTKIVNKTIMGKGKVQLNFFDGRNLIVDNDSYKTGDSLVISFKDKKILNHLKLEKGSMIYIIKGKRAGMVGKLIDFKKLNEGKTNVLFESEGEKIETSKDYVLVIGDMKLKNE